MSETDQPVKIRDGEELPMDVLRKWMTLHIPVLKGDLHIRQFPGGFSNLTYAIQDEDGHQWVLRRPPFGANIATAHDMHREYQILKALHPATGMVPAPVAFCDDESILGAQFYLMERVHGIILRTTGAKSDSLSSEQFRELSHNFTEKLAQLHSFDWNSSPDLRKLARPEGYVGRQISGWTKRYRKAQTDDIPGLEQMAKWLDEEQPAESGFALIHNDFKYDNLVLDESNPSRIKAILDWEMATIGDPLMDLGTSMGYWTESGDPDALKMFGLTHMPGNLKRSEIISRYEEITGNEIDEPVFYYVYGLFKIAVICQQIFARFKSGKTHDPRFGALIHVVNACAKSGLSALEKGKL